MRLIDADELITIEIDEADPPFRFIPAEFIEAAPTIDAVPVVRGKWEEWWPGDCALIMTGEEMLWMCSKCTAKFSDQSNFCPNCGAMMTDDFCSQGERKKQQGDGTLCEEGHW